MHATLIRTQATMTPSADAALSTLSELSQPDFVARLGDIFEHSPWVAERSWHARPFPSIDALHAAMVTAMTEASEAEQLALAGKEAASGTLTAASTGEQRGAGLDQCSAEELQRLRSLNAAYQERFGFPFVIAVKGRSRYQIMDAIEARLQNDAQKEFATCLGEIAQIARFRLYALLA